MSVKEKFAPKVQKTPTIEEPNIFYKAGSLTAALARWAAHGFVVVEEPQYLQRKSICDTCINPETGKENFDPEAYGGMGKCLVCGCMGFKQILKTETCPLNKW